MNSPPGSALAAEAADLLPTPTSRVRLSFAANKTSLIEAFAQSRPSSQAATQLLRGLAKLVDDTLVQLWQHSGMPGAAALVAVGGYGRGELFPHSDVDVLLLLPPNVAATEIKTPIERFVTACWDVGLEIGSSVRNIDECAADIRRHGTDPHPREGLA